MLSRCGGRVNAAEIRLKPRTRNELLFQEDSMVSEGKPAPDFELVDDSGETVTLSSFRGKPVVLYFYPKDETQSPIDSRNR